MRDKAPVVSDKPLTPAEVLQVSTQPGPAVSTETSFEFDARSFSALISFT